jgi:NADH-quinone oxidoreductase subunit L
MSDLPFLMAAIPALPLAAAILIAFLGPRFLKQHSHWPCVLAIALSCVLSVRVFLAIHGAMQGAEQTQPQETHAFYSWLQVGTPGQAYSVDVGLTLRADALTAMMLVMVTFVGTLIATYAAGYMAGDPGYPRFFAEVSLFVASMTLLVLADNFLVLYAGWEGVGLCSYLLIGFWFTKPSAANAARKAFLVTRLGDAGMMLGILLLWFTYGFHFDYNSVFGEVQRQHDAGTLNHGMLLAVCLLLFCGAVGKSAQFPLHVWLPDAMEGPTPVSALIHAATMVTAGVYLVARCSPLFSLVPEAQLVVACIGGFTAIFAALIALTQFDLKRVLAYSTLSQLGYMFLALGCGVMVGSKSLLGFAVVAAMFHLFTHAFFKALLFLSAGSVMHAMGGVIDMRRFSGLGRVLPRTHITFLCGALALAGFPFLSGFWSKDEILAAANVASGSARFGNVYFILLIVGLVTAALTAFYTFRAYFMTFHGDLKVPPEAGSHGHGDEYAHDHGHAPTPAPVPMGHGETPGQVHESPAIMTVPLMVLAVFAVGVGFALGPTHLFAGFVGRTPGLPELHEEPMNVPLMIQSSLLALGGIAVAWMMYVRRPALAGQLAKVFPRLYQLSFSKFHVDEIYEAFVVAPLNGLAGFARVWDYHLIDGLVDLIGQVPRLVGYLFRPVQNGLVQFYALAMVLALAVFLVALMRSL